MSLFFYWFGVPGSRPGSLCAFTRVACYSIGHAFLTFTGDNWLISHFFSFGVNLARSRVNCGHWLRGTPPNIVSGSSRDPLPGGTPPKICSGSVPGLSSGVQLRRASEDPFRIRHASEVCFVVFPPFVVYNQHERKKFYFRSCLQAVRLRSGRLSFSEVCSFSGGVRSWFSPIEILNKMRAHFKARHFANKIN